MEKNAYLCLKLGNMYKIAVLEYSVDDRHGKLYAVKAIKERLNLGLLEAKHWVEGLPKQLDNQDEDDLKFYQEHFRCEVAVIREHESPYYSNHNIQEPDEATAAALVWLSAQPDFIKENVKLIGEWENKPCFLVATC